MRRRTWAPFLLGFAWTCLLLGIAHGAPATADDTKREEVVQMRVGEQRELSFAALARFSVGNATILVVKRIEGDRVWVEALRPGETWLEVVHGARAYTAVRVVVSAAVAAVPSPAAGVSPSPAASASPSPAASASSSPAAGASPSPTAAPTPKPGANERALTLQENDFRFGLELDYGVDTQVFPTLLTLVAPNGQVASATVSTRVKRQFEMIPVTFDWSASRQDRLTAVLPFVNSDQVSSGSFGSSHARASGLGDIGLTWEHMFDRRPVGGWETGLQVSGTFPTGRSVYDITNPDELPLGIGHYQVGSGLVVRRVSDPLALYATLGLNYTLPRLFNGNRISPGLGFNASSGISWAMSDQWALSEQITYARRPNIFLASPTLTVTQNVDQAYITQAVTYSSRRGDFLLRLIFSAGLNDASTDFIGGVSAQWRR